MEWYTGTNQHVTFDDITDIVASHYAVGGTIYVGTDSHVQQKKCVFSTSICLLGNINGVNNRYFFTRHKDNSKKYSTLLQRITVEVQKSIDIGLKLLEFCPKIDIELHLDISPENKNETTSVYSKMLVGYARGNGFDCKIKPNAFAASSVADRHSKVNKKKK